MDTNFDKSPLQELLEGARSKPVTPRQGAVAAPQVGEATVYAALDRYLEAQKAFDASREKAREHLGTEGKVQLNEYLLALRTGDAKRDRYANLPVAHDPKCQDVIAKAVERNTKEAEFRKLLPEGTELGPLVERVQAQRQHAQENYHVAEDALRKASAPLASNLKLNAEQEKAYNAAKADFKEARKATLALHGKTETPQQVDAVVAWEQSQGVQIARAALPTPPVAANTPAPAPAPAAPAAPARTPAPAVAAADGSVKVKPGDTLGIIAGTQDAAWAKTAKAIGGKPDDLTVRLALAMTIAKVNGIEKPDHIEAGKTLKMPTKEQIAETVAELKKGLLKDDNKITVTEYKNQIQHHTLAQALAPSPTPTMAGSQQGQQRT